MRKTVCGMLVLLTMASASFGQSLIGARASGMGGAGVAAMRDMSCAYYNPAAMMRQGKVGFMGSVGAAYNGFDQIMNAASSASDPAKFVTDNFSKSLTANGSLNGLLGGNFSKIGLTLLPAISLNLSKPANSLAANGGAGLMYAGVLTLGYTFGLPALPSLDVGANLKYLGGMGGTLAVTTNPFTNISNGTKAIYNSSGVGVDLGALMTFDIPMVTSVSVGLAARDLGETINTTTTPYTLTSAAGSQTFTETKLADVSTSKTADATYALGVAGTVPVVGILLAADLESGNGFSNTHFGLEYPLLANFLVLRAGLASGNNLSLTTVGAKVGIPFLALNVAMVMDGKNDKNNSVVFDFGGGL